LSLKQYVKVFLRTLNDCLNWHLGRFEGLGGKNWNKQQVQFSKQVRIIHQRVVVEVTVVLQLNQGE
jgi:hypothetical protein